MNEEERQNSVFTRHAYNVNLTVEDGSENLIVPEKWIFAYNVSGLSRELFFGLFDLVKNQSLSENYVEDIEDEFGNLINVLFQKFNLDHLDDQGSLEGSIEKYISKLNDFIFFLPKSLVKEKKEGLSSLEFDIGYEGNIDTIAEYFKERLKSLREEKVSFWKRLFEEYKKDKEGYDLGFRTKRIRFDKDLDRASKITSEDLKNIFRQKVF
ncbi:MAG: hypothetical protein KGD58_11000 [Candidatus Lokiarchaeota archaeon]|nr:hypothetical protein [Candidatus Lokiarchaeota archaeon]